MTCFRRLINFARSAVQSRSVASYTLKNKVAVITGGTRGIGLAVAKELLIEGASQVIIAGRDQNVGVKSLKLLKEICGDKQMAKYCEMDITSMNDVRRLFKETDNENTRLDILVNAGGVLNESKDGWRNMINTNVKGMIDCTNLGMKLMNHRNRPGVIVNFSSIFAIRPIPQLPLFSGTHAAVLGALLGFKKMENSDVRLLTVCMGPTDTTMLHNLSETDVGEWAKDDLLNLTDALKIRLSVEVAAKYITEIMKSASHGSIHVVTKSTQKEKRKPKIEFTKTKIIQL